MNHPPSSPTGPSRRTLVRLAGASAWAAPAIVAATAAPAMAATGPASVSAVVVATRSASGPVMLDVTFTNANSMPAVTFTYTADQQLAGNSTKKLVVEIQLAPTPGPGTVAVRGEPGGGTGATTTRGVATF